MKICCIGNDLVLFQTLFLSFFSFMLIGFFYRVIILHYLFVGFVSGDRGMMSMAGGMAQAMLSKPGGNLS